MFQKNGTRFIRYSTKICVCVTYKRESKIVNSDLALDPVRLLGLETFKEP